MADEMKGRLGGKCNRTACGTNIPAEYFNKSTLMYYCSVCASILNHKNRADSRILYGGLDLCEKTNVDQSKA